MSVHACRVAALMAVLILACLGALRMLMWRPWLLPPPEKLGSSASSSREQGGNSKVEEDSKAQSEDQHEDGVPPDDGVPRHLLAKPSGGAVQGTPPDKARQLPL